MRPKTGPRPTQFDVSSCPLENRPAGIEAHQVPPSRRPLRKSLDWLETTSDVDRTRYFFFTSSSPDSAAMNAS